MASVPLSRALLRNSLIHDVFPDPSFSRREGWVAGFSRQATEWRGIAAMTVGGIAHRVGRMGALGFRVGAYGRTPLQVASIAAGLSAEVSAFELTHRGLTSFPVGARSPRPQFFSHGTGGEIPPLRPENPNLWGWSGPGGLRE